MGIFHVPEFNKNNYRLLNEMEVNGNKVESEDDDDYTKSDDENTKTPDKSSSDNNDDEDYTAGIGDDDGGYDNNGEDASSGTDDDEDYTAGIGDDLGEDDDNDGDDDSSGITDDGDDDYTAGVDGAGEGDDEGSDDDSGDGDDDYTAGIDGAGEDDGSEGDDSGDGDMDGDSDGSEGEEGGDEEGDGEAKDSFEDLKRIEAELFSSLTPEQMAIKDAELKQNLIDLHTTIGSVLLRINNVAKSEENIEILKFVTDKLIELREMVNFNITKAYATRTHTENNIIYQQCLSILNNISEILASIPSPIKDIKEEVDYVITWIANLKNDKYYI